MNHAKSKLIETELRYLATRVLRLAEDLKVEREYPDVNSDVMDRLAELGKRIVALREI